MKTWLDLSEAVQEKVIQEQMDQILSMVAVGALRFEDEDGKDSSFQAQLDEALAFASRDPDRAGEIIMSRCGDELSAFVRGHCMRAIYVNPNELVIQLGWPEYNNDLSEDQ